MEGTLRAILRSADLTPAVLGDESVVAYNVVI
jgi:hypothetical protein